VTTPRRRFRPSETWNLEDRLAPSHIGATAEIAAMATHAQRSIGTIRGLYSTTSKFGVDTVGATIALSGTATVTGFGSVTLRGSLANNLVVPNHGGPTSGALVLTAANKTGTLTLVLSGGYGNLAPSTSDTIALKFTVVKATGSYTAGLGVKGTAVLTLTETTPPTGGLATHTSTSGGKFSLTFSV
jgi:hypothetical protein